MSSTLYSLHEPLTDHTEDLPDPFKHDYSPPRAPVSPDTCANDPSYIVYVLVAWLHEFYHLPFRACNVVLVVFTLLFKAIGINIELYLTLNTVLMVLDLEPSFKIWPVCPNCLEVHPSHSPTLDAVIRCIKCDTALFDNKPTAAQARKGQTERNVPRPLLQFPTKSLTEQLASLLLLPGLEDAMEAWRQLPRVPGEYRDIFDGEVCRNILGPDGKEFFQYGPSESSDGELRIGVTLGADWYGFLHITLLNIN